MEHGADHCEQAPAPSFDPPCTDIEKTSNDPRPAHVAAPWIVLASVLPVPRAQALTRTPLPDPEPPPRYRPLHLEKSVLLI
jgi:hypothetical protein